jgi:DNA-binding NarL/FixJ family response regulator
MCENVKVRVMIADDQQLFAEGLRVVIESRAPRFEVVGIAQNGKIAVSMARDLKPDVILMDVRMPEMDGVVATRLIHEKYPEIKILILTTFDDDEYVKFSLRNGAIGYLLKNRPAEELVESIKALARGIIQIDPAVSAKFFDAGRSQDSDSDDFNRRLNTLTGRERGILEQLVQAKRIVNIASDLEIAEQTVRNHISSIYFKLDIHDRLEIINYVNQIRYFLDKTREKA